MPEILGQDVELDSRFPHGSNIYKKLTDRAIQADVGKRTVITNVAARYLEWRVASLDSRYGENEDEELAFIEAQTALYQNYRDLLDEPQVDIFDSRGALQPSALEEFCFFLFRPLLEEIPHEVALGHHNVYQGLYFTAANFHDFARMPTPQYPVGNLDFVIGKRLESRLETESLQRSQTIYVPAVAVECKTYLDRPRYIESDILAANIKRGFPRCLYILISEFLKLDLAKVNVFGSPIDRIYVFRRVKNVDRSIRRESGVTLAPMHVPAVVDFFRVVRDHLHDDWHAPEDWTASGILK